MTIKCILGVLANDMLGIDLSIIQPIHVLEGRGEVMEVLVMALVVVAHRRGTPLAALDRIDTSKDLLLDVDQNDSLPDPIEPSFSSTYSSVASDIFAPQTGASLQLAPKVVEPSSGITVDPNTRHESGASGKTVLQQMIEEFGLGLEC